MVANNKDVDEEKEFYREGESALQPGIQAGWLLLACILLGLYVLGVVVIGKTLHSVRTVRFMAPDLTLPSLRVEDLTDRAVNTVGKTADKALDQVAERAAEKVVDEVGQQVSEGVKQTLEEKLKSR